MHNDGENFTLNSFSTEFPTTTIQSATDCLRTGRKINQLRQLCLPSTQSLSSVDCSEPTYSFLTSLNTNEDDDTLDELPDDADAFTDDDEDNLKGEINLYPDNYRLCEAKAAHVAVLGRIDNSLI